MGSKLMSREECGTRLALREKKQHELLSRNMQLDLDDLQLQLEAKFSTAKPCFEMHRSRGTWVRSDTVNICM